MNDKEIITVTEKPIAKDLVEKDTKLDFDKFTRTKNSTKLVQKKQNKLFNKMDFWLRTKKSLLIIWIILAILTILIVAIDIIYITMISPNLSASSGPYFISKSVAMSGVIMAYISCCILALPYLFLLGCWFIGINGVYHSRMFHIFFWSIMLISIVLFLAASGTSIYVIVEAATFRGI